MVPLDTVFHGIVTKEFQISWILLENMVSFVRMRIDFACVWSQRALFADQTAFGLMLVLTRSSGSVAVLWRRGSELSQLSSLQTSPLYVVAKIRHAAVLRELKGKRVRKQRWYCSSEGPIAALWLGAAARSSPGSGSARGTAVGQRPLPWSAPFLLPRHPYGAVSPSAPGCGHGTAHSQPQPCRAHSPLSAPVATSFRNVTCCVKPLLLTVSGRSPLYRCLPAPLLHGLRGLLPLR